MEESETPEPITFTGNYASWEEAERASTGYSAADIFTKTRKATLAVKNGEAAFERDSVLFEEEQYEFPLLAGLLRTAAANAGSLSVLDFGGALGSTYFQCRNFLSVTSELHWNVVEQPTHVACGQKEIADDQLRFYSSIEECLRFEKPKALLLSSVLQYLPKPYQFLGEALSHKFDSVIVDRTPFMRDGRSRLTVQHVPASIYPASYPAWFLSEPEFMACFHSEYRLLTTFPGRDKINPEEGEADFKGFIFELK